MGFSQTGKIYQCLRKLSDGEGGGGNWRQQESPHSDLSNHRHLLPEIKASVALKNSLMILKIGH